jgi:hypothetical protein
MPLILPSNSISAGGFAVDNSLRFDDGSSDYLNRTGTTATDGKKFTLSLWFKRANLGNNKELFCIYLNNSNRMFFRNNGDDFELQIQSKSYNISGSRQFRDTSAWYHFVIIADSTEATDSDRIKWYVNGERQTLTAGSGYPALNDVFPHGQGSANYYIGNGEYNSTPYTSYWDGYMAEVCFIDGSALDPTSFGEFDEDTGIWKPIDVSGLTFGTNGFYLDFENSGSLGNDKSGNGNNFTVNNLTSIDQTTDTPTNNFATLNPLDKSQSTATYSEGNLKWSTTSGYFWGRANIGVSSGKWYFEAKLTSAPEHAHVGIVDEAPDDNTDSIEGGTYNWGYKNSSGQIWNNSSSSSYGSTYTTGDIIGVYLDLDNNKLYFAKNGTIQNSGTGISITDPASTDTGNYFFAVGDNASATNGTWEANFGNPTFTISSGNSDPNGYGNFEYSPNDGGSASFDSSAKDFYALNTKNLAEYG